MPLKSRRSFPPRGYVFFEPRTNWSVAGGLTFEQVVEAIIKHRKANPRFTDWALSVEDVSNELDSYTCARINNDPNYCDGGESPPFPMASLSTPTMLRRFKNVGDAAAGKAKQIVTGIGLIADWLGSGAKPVSKELAEKRAGICASCPNNNQASLSDIFTVPASEMIRKTIAIKNDMKLETSHDEKLGICGICACPMKTKVWCDLKHVLAYTKPEVMQTFPDFCWIKSSDK